MKEGFKHEGARRVHMQQVLPPSAQGSVSRQVTVRGRVRLHITPRVVVFIIQRHRQRADN